jgi:hypothetical protein
MNTRDDTQDIRRYRRRPDDPNASEARTRRFGTICLSCGIALPVIVYLAGMVVAVVTENDAFHHESARLFVVLGMVALTGLGFMLITIGGMERLHRPTRAAADRNRILLERLTLEVRERYDSLAGLVAPLPGRLTRIEETIDRVPAYGEAVIEGITLGRDPSGPNRN